MFIDLSKEPFFEVSEGTRVELFIDGVSRAVAFPRDSRLFLVIVPDLVESDELPF